MSSPTGNCDLSSGRVHHQQADREVACPWRHRGSRPRPRNHAEDGGQKLLSSTFILYLTAKYPPCV